MASFVWRKCSTWWLPVGFISVATWRRFSAILKSSPRRGVWFYRCGAQAVNITLRGNTTAVIGMNFQWWTFGWQRLGIFHFFHPRNLQKCLECDITWQQIPLRTFHTIFSLSLFLPPTGLKGFSHHFKEVLYCHVFVLYRFSVDTALRFFISTFHLNTFTGPRVKMRILMCDTMKMTKRAKQLISLLKGWKFRFMMMIWVRVENKLFNTLSLSLAYHLPWMTSRKKECKTIPSYFATFSQPHKKKLSPFKKPFLWHE